MEEAWSQGRGRQAGEGQVIELPLSRPYTSGKVSVGNILSLKIKIIHNMELASLQAVGRLSSEKHLTIRNSAALIFGAK